MGLLEEQKAERTERILSTARRLIAERGYNGINMRDLARESRVSVPTVYKLCGDKNEVLAKAVQGQFTELLRAFTQAGGKTGLERVMAIVEGCGRELVRLSRYSHAVLAVLVGSGQMGEVSELIAGALSDGIEAGLNEMKESRQLAPWADPRTLAEQIAGLTILSTIEWETGHLADENLQPAMVYGTALMLASATRGAASKRLVDQARQVQGKARSLRRGGKALQLRSLKR